MKVFNTSFDHSITQSPAYSSFRCRTKSVEYLRDYGKVVKDTGIINNKRLDIYSAYDTEGNLIHKLYYLADSVGNWIKSKLKYYKGRQVVKVIRSENERSKATN